MLEFIETKDKRIVEYAKKNRLAYFNGPDGLFYVEATKELKKFAHFNKYDFRIANTIFM